MSQGARTPEELETLFEDAFVTRDELAVARLFEDSALLVSSNGRGSARGGEAAARMARTMWECELTYVADPRRVFQAGDTALVLTGRGINVARRARGASWRYAI